MLRQIDNQKFDALLPSWTPDLRERKIETVFLRYYSVRKGKKINNN